jgi:hypothetical protein
MTTAPRAGLIPLRLPLDRALHSNAAEYINLQL